MEIINGTKSNIDIPGRELNIEHSTDDEGNKLILMSLGVDHIKHHGYEKFFFRINYVKSDGHTRYKMFEFNINEFAIQKTIVLKNIAADVDVNAEAFYGQNGYISENSFKRQIRFPLERNYH